MKIAILAGADSIHTQRWANAFVGRGHEVALLSVHEPIAGYDVRVRIHNLRIKAPFGYILNVFEVRSVLKNIEPDVVNTHYASGYGTLASLAGFRPNVLNVWGSDVYEFPEKNWLCRRVLLANLRAASRLCSTSLVMAERVRTLDPELKEISVTPFGIDFDVFRPMNGLRSQDEIVVGTVKTLAPKYGISTLIRAFALARLELRRIDLAVAERLRLRLVGGGPQREDLERLCRELGVEEVTRFVGAVPYDQVPAELNKLDVYCALSESASESFGVAIVEASACELPVVVSRIGGLVEVTEGDRTALHVNAGDFNQAAKAIIDLVLNPEKARQMGKEGRRFVEERYSWARNVDTLEEVLRNAATGWSV